MHFAPHLLFELHCDSYITGCLWIMVFLILFPCYFYSTENICVPLAWQAFFFFLTVTFKAFWDCYMSGALYCSCLGLFMKHRFSAIRPRRRIVLLVFCGSSHNGVVDAKLFGGRMSFFFFLCVLICAVENKCSAFLNLASRFLFCLLCGVTYVAH